MGMLSRNGLKWVLWVCVVASQACQCNSTTATDGGGTDGGGASGLDAGPNDVLMARRNFSRDGVYIDPSMTKAAVANMHVDTTFNATTSAQSYAQALFMENGPDGGDTLFVATENNDVFALDAKTGRQIWMTNVGAAAALGAPFCGGSINPWGITGTPAIDPFGRVIYFDAMLAQGDGGVPGETVFALGLDKGNVLWSVDLNSAVSGFDSTIQSQRSAVLLLNGWLYVVFSGQDGDCGDYKGWVIAINAANHADVKSWHTTATSGSGIWGPSGPASDGTNVYVATCNTNSDNRPTSWDGGYSEAVIKLTPNLTFTEAAANFFAPSGPNGQDWYANDLADTDLGSSGLVMFDAPGATPTHLVFVVGKTQNGYVLDRDNLGGLALGVAPTIPRTDAQVFGSLLAYNTSKPATYVSGRFNVSSTGFCTNGGADFTVLQVTHANPPDLKFAWCGVSGGDGEPIVSTTDGVNEAIVWTYGASGDEIVRAYDGDTGALLYTSPALSGSTHWISPIVAKGRFYVAENGTVSALTIH